MMFVAWMPGFMILFMLGVREWTHPGSLRRDATNMWSSAKPGEYSKGEKRRRWIQQLVDGYSAKHNVTVKWPSRGP